MEGAYTRCFVMLVEGATSLLHTMNNLPFDVNNSFQFPGGVNVSLGQGLEFNPQNDIGDNFDNIDDFDFPIDFNDPMLVDAFDFMDTGLNPGANATMFPNGTNDTSLFLPDSDTDGSHLTPASEGASSDSTDPTYDDGEAPSLFLPSTNSSHSIPASGDASAADSEGPSNSIGESHGKDGSAYLAVPITKPTFLSFEPTTHAQRNPLLPTQSVRARPKRKLDPVQARTMNEAKAEKQRLAMLARDDILKLAMEFEENIKGLAEKHSVTVEYLKGLMSMASKYKRKRAAGRMQALIHLKGKEINSTLPTGSKLKAPALRKLVEEDEELRTLSGEKVEEAKREVDAQRLLSTRGIRPTNLSAAKDYSAFSRSLTPSMFEQAPWASDSSVPGPPMIKVSLPELELWTSKKEKPATIVEIQSQCSVMIASSLRYILKDKSMNMNYASYHTNIVAKHHVQLIGLPDSKIFIDANGPIKPFDIKERKALEALHAGLSLGLVVGRRSNAGDDNGENQAPPPKRQRISSQKSKAQTAGSRGGQSTAAQKARIRKKLPPKPSSAEFIDTDEDTDGSGSDGDEGNSA
ncbi:hypothetical protein BDP27DRAFT_1413728 [Rhodocollybia butyracea]|uniref:Uncharacterized protein n=1 Tax=Rhodocollybia butyracea TaxID=206335 RepID=A0A9P5Q972_9AGAR|nr:hypothetical protein BDP27DRAFT_1413728 [Rhodocollybia butyracea]